MSGQSGLLSETLPPKQKGEPVGEVVSIACRLLPSGEKKDWKSELTRSFLLSSLRQPLVLYLGSLLQSVDSWSPENGPLTLLLSIFLKQ